MARRPTGMSRAAHFVGTIAIILSQRPSDRGNSRAASENSHFLAGEVNTGQSPVARALSAVVVLEIPKPKSKRPVDEVAGPVVVSAIWDLGFLKVAIVAVP
jgi:hypothetical protein